MTSPGQSYASPSFPGFDLPEQNWFKMPNKWTDLTADINSLAELKVVEYVLKHTWGYHKFGIPRQITTDEFMYGRKRGNGTRIDRGTGLSNRSVIDGLRRAVKHSYLIEKVDDRDKARIKKHYSLRMKPQVEASQPDVNMGHLAVKNLHTGVKHLHSRGVVSSPRTEQDTLARKQQQEKQVKAKNGSSSSSGGEQDLAAALIEKGIEAKVAQQFASRYSRQRIEDNLDWLAWKQKNEANLTNPAGLLRRAIENDYVSEGHHKGFQTRRQKAAAAAKQKQRLQAQQRLVAARERQQVTSLQQKERERVKRLEILRERYGTTAQEVKLWSQVLSRLKKEITPVTFSAYLAQSALLSLREGKALVVVPNRFVKERIEDCLSAKIQRALGDHLPGQAVTIQCLALDEGRNE